MNEFSNGMSMGMMKMKYPVKNENEGKIFWKSRQK